MKNEGFPYLYMAELDAWTPHFWDSVEIILDEGVRELEQRLAGYVGVERCAAVSDAASGIELALRASGVGAGDTVLCAALGCAVPVRGTLLAGARPAFVDVNPNTFTVDPFCVECALDRIKRAEEPMPRALIATDLFGAPCGYKALRELCERHSVTLIEDASGAFGATLNGRKAGSFGRFAVVSFAARDPLDELGGGAVFCRNKQDADAVEALRRAGSQQFIGELATSLPWMGAADIALTAAKLENFERELSRRRTVAERYGKALRNVPIRPQQMLQGASGSYSRYVVAIPKERERSRVVERMLEMRIPCGAPAGEREACYGAQSKAVPVNTLAIGGRLLSLPINPYMSGHVVDYICECLSRALVETGDRESRPA